ncbi:MAG: DinB family protein [Acidimicrobiales bacterium]
MDSISAKDNRVVLDAGNEWDQLDSWLSFYRETLLIKCDGLGLDQLKQRPVVTSRLSLLGLIRHMTKVERYWFETVFLASDVPVYYSTPEDKDGDYNNVDELGLDEVLKNYHNAVATSDECAAGHNLDELAKTSRGEQVVDLRWIYLHMIEEYARHCGHADIIRELIDGVTGY